MSQNTLLENVDINSITGLDFMDRIVAQIKNVQGLIALRTNYQTADKTGDLWLLVTPYIVPTAESVALAEGTVAVSPTSTVH